jgi:hypothetical protein
MTKCQVKKFDSVVLDANTLCEEIEVFLNSQEQEVKSVQMFTMGRYLVLIALFEKK